MIRRLDRSAMPRHVAVLANDSRWRVRFNASGQPLVAGCRAGAVELQRFVEWCDDISVPVITLQVLNTGNLDRSVTDELELLLEAVDELAAVLVDTGRWQVQTVGGLDLPPKEQAANPRALAARAEAMEGMYINVAVSCSDRHELCDTFRLLLAGRAVQGRILEEMAAIIEIDEISEHPYTRGQPDPDLIIRTSGEQ